MKAIVVKDQAAGTAGMTLVERPEPQAAINDVVVQVHASGFTWDDANLDKYLANPSGFIHGTRMLINLPSDTDRQNVIAYLNTLKQ